MYNKRSAGFQKHLKKKNEKQRCSATVRCFCFPAPESDPDAVVENVPTLLHTNTQVPKVRKPHHSTVQYKSCGKREREEEVEREKKGWRESSLATC